MHFTGARALLWRNVLTHLRPVAPPTRPPLGFVYFFFSLFSISAPNALYFYGWPVLSQKFQLKFLKSFREAAEVVVRGAYCRQGGRGETGAWGRAPRRRRASSRRWMGCPDLFGRVWENSGWRIVFFFGNVDVCVDCLKRR
ncbi:hypothetical protein EVAR_50291_1 [Eumeta japonica]|uniref:Uncharacterized protein n=1 Tax=Eumeta variegata TaxID=151549 RepID=A0A4C1XSG6_EUMVA|nr:hypothetical protein EVAR_50291_1 [Eumeta japonica]